MANALINSAPLIAGITDPDSRANLVGNFIYPVARLLIGNDLADKLILPKSGMLKMRAWATTCPTMRTPRNPQIGSRPSPRGSARDLLSDSGVPVLHGVRRLHEGGAGHEAEASGDAPPITSIHCRLPTLRIGEGTHQRVQPKPPRSPAFWPRIPDLRTSAAPSSIPPHNDNGRIIVRTADSIRPSLGRPALDPQILFEERALAALDSAGRLRPARLRGAVLDLLSCSKSS